MELKQVHLEHLLLKCHIYVCAMRIFTNKTAGRKAVFAAVCNSNANKSSCKSAQTFVLFNIKNVITSFSLYAFFFVLQNFIEVMHLSFCFQLMAWRYLLSSRKMNDILNTSLSPPYQPCKLLIVQKLIKLWSHYLSI